LAKLRKRFDTIFLRDPATIRPELTVFAMGFIAFLVVAILSFPTSSSAADTRSPQELKTIIDLQPFRETSSIRVKEAGGSEAQVTLINLNPHINAWYLLQVGEKGAGGLSP